MSKVTSDIEESTGEVDEPTEALMERRTADTGHAISMRIAEQVREQVAARLKEMEDKVTDRKIEAAELETRLDRHRQELVQLQDETKRHQDVYSNTARDLAATRARRDKEQADHEKLRAQLDADIQKRRDELAKINATPSTAPKGVDTTSSANVGADPNYFWRPRTVTTAGPSISMSGPGYTATSQISAGLLKPKDDDRAEVIRLQAQVAMQNEKLALMFQYLEQQPGFHQPSSRFSSNTGASTAQAAGGIHATQTGLRPEPSAARRDEPATIRRKESKEHRSRATLRDQIASLLRGEQPPATPSDLSEDEDEQGQEDHRATQLDNVSKLDREARDATLFRASSGATSGTGTWQRPLTSKHAAVHRPVLFERRESAERERPVSPSAHLKLPAPAMYRPSNNIEAWLTRVDIHMSQINVHSSRKRALTYLSYLSADAYDRLWKLQLPMDIWTDADALRKQLQLVFGECKTLHSYRAEFNAAKQQTNEMAVEFFDRLYGLLLSAYPGENPNTNRVMQEMLVSQFVTGLRSVSLRMTMLRVQYN